MNTNRSSKSRSNRNIVTLIPILLIILFSKSCISYTPVESDQEKTQVTIHTVGYAVYPILILDVQYEGHQHEMLYYEHGLEHWPSCKYCSEDSSEQCSVSEHQEVKPLKQMEIIRKLTITPSGSNK